MIRKVFLTLGLMLSTGTAAWAIPQTLNFQGFLKESGSPVTGTRDMTFGIYAAQSGGSAIFSEAHTGSDTVAVSTGIFTALIGNLTSGGIPLSVFDGSDRYVEVAVGSTTLPRQKITSVGNAFFSATAANLVPTASIQIASISALSATFTAIGADQYSLNTSSGILVSSGGVTAPFFFGSFVGNGSALSGISSTDATKVAKAGDTMTGNLTLKQLAHTINAAGNSGGSTKDIDWSAGAVQTVTLNGNSTFTFSGAVAGQTLTLILLQDGTGGRTISWPTTAKWPAATPPTLSASGKTDIVSIFYDGSSYWGITGGLNYSATLSAPVITSALTASGTQNAAITNYTITASNSPTSYGATNLPAGLSLTGAVISGTPTGYGTTNTTISATNAAGTGSSTLVWSVAQQACSHGSQVWTSAVTTTFTVPAGCNSLTIDLRGPGGGGGGSAASWYDEYDQIWLSYGGGGGGGGAAGSISANYCNMSDNGAAGTSSYVMRGGTTLAQAAVGAGGNGGNDGNGAGAGGSAGADSYSGLTLTTSAGGAGGAGGVSSGAPGSAGSAGNKVTGSISATPGETLNVQVGSPGQTTPATCGLGGAAGSPGYLSITW